MRKQSRRKSQGAQRRARQAILDSRGLVFEQSSSPGNSIAGVVLVKNLPPTLLDYLKTPKMWAVERVTGHYIEEVLAADTLAQLSAALGIPRSTLGRWRHKLGVGTRWTRLDGDREYHVR